MSPKLYVVYSNVVHSSVVHSSVVHSSVVHSRCCIFKVLYIQGVVHSYVVQTSVVHSSVVHSRCCTNEVAPTQESIDVHLHVRVTNINKNIVDIRLLLSLGLSMAKNTIKLIINEVFS